MHLGYTWYIGKRFCKSTSFLFSSSSSRIEPMGCVGKVSSEVTKVPLAELRRLFVMESKLSECMEKKDTKKMVKCGER